MHSRWSSGCAGGQSRRQTGRATSLCCVASAQRSLRGLARAAVSGLSRAAGRLRPGAADRPPWERSVVDDVAMRRPWNLAVKAARLRGRLRLRRLRDGVTVVIVNWNTRDVTADAIRAVQHFSSCDVRILVVDNGSTDGSREMLRNWPGVETMLLRANAGHGPALDLAVCSVRTRIAVTLDSDAVPLSDDWLEPAVAPVRSGRAVLAGSRSRRNFVHPIYLAVDVAEFVRRGLSFQVHRLRDVDDDAARWGENAWDTAELMTPMLAPAEVVFVERTPNAVDGLPGMTAGGVVYHHGGVSRDSDGGMTEEAFAGWRNACRSLGLGFLEAEPAE